MPIGETTRFQCFHDGMKWSERAHLGALESVLYAGGSERENLLMHAQSLFGANLALALSRKRGLNQGMVIDFGCGTGRTVRFFGNKGWSVFGTEVTLEMLSEARKFGLLERAILALTDGVSIPVGKESVDMIWVSGVLKYALFDSSSICRGGTGPDKVANDRVYHDIVAEMYRVLKPGGLVVNVEMWVDAPPQVFMDVFQQVGFVIDRVRVLRRYLGLFEKLLQWRPWHRFPPGQVIAAGMLSAALRYWLDSPKRRAGGFRDYLFVWSKPKSRK